MSLEQLKIVNEKKNLTPEMLNPELIKGLEESYKQEVAHLRQKNQQYLNKTNRIKSEDMKKGMKVELGLVSIQAANIEEELQVGLN